MAASPTEVEVVRRYSVKAWSWFEDTVSDVTAEQANWWPPGTANSIGATYLHVVINTDVEISRLIHGCEPLVEQWQGNVGQPLPYDPDRFDRWVRQGPVEWELLRRYGRAVHASGARMARCIDRSAARYARRHDACAGLECGRAATLFVLHGFEHPQMHGARSSCDRPSGWRAPFESEDFRAALEVVEYLG